MSDIQYVSAPENPAAIVACAVLLPPSTVSEDQVSVTVSPVDFEEILDSFAVRFGDEVFDDIDVGNGSLPKPIH
jgi:hypothetical protein